MCNRYGHWASITALRERAARMELEFYLDAGIGNLEPQPNIYADQDGPILMGHKNGVALRKARWGLPPFRERDAKGRLERPRNNIRKTDFWQQRYPEVMLQAEHRCLVPFSAFAEPVRDSTWFTLPGEEVAFFAGVCMDWSGERLKAQPGQTRRKREVVLTDPDECKEWLAGRAESLRLQRPLDNGLLEIVDSADLPEN